MTQTLIIDNERPESWNDVIKCHHTKRSEYRDKWLEAVKYCAYAQKIKPITKLVDIYVSAYMDTRGYDSDNIVIKYMIDALRHCNILKNDTNKHIRWSATRTVSIKNHSEKPRIEIKIIEVDNND